MPNVRELDVETPDGRILHAYDTGSYGDRDAVVFWHHGTPNTGEPPRPLFEAAKKLGVRWVSFDRPSYGGSTPNPGRDVASSAGDVAAVADAVGVDRFAAIGHSGGGPHALSGPALLPGRAVAVASIAGLAPFDAEGLDWFEGMIESGKSALLAAAAGREAKVGHEMAHGADYDPEFTSSDIDALNGEWSWLGRISAEAAAAGSEGLVDDDVAYVSPWGFEPADVSAPALFLYGRMDRIVPASHGAWLAGHCPAGDLRIMPDAGHISILEEAASALRWVRERL